ncbi:hypothetical protein MKK63_24175 [Methylobacterium sp. J-088]|uniref:hypothetical protein n=1 Tax=Methylobacterium sp. J-088 TaxID=2836664 RepID=UPI001FBA24D4|nr:hypothetical protein [Methylobacterium sp. J-088]MCJ2065777.1 hypothetical protein [Methylobacterium sp. J-088]
MASSSCRARVAALLIAVLAGGGAARAAGDTPALNVAPAPSGPAGLATADPPTLRYGVLYADAEGRSHVQYCDLKNFAFKSYAPPAPPQYVGAPPGDVASIAYAVLPVGYVGPWHAAPGPQWVVTLSGRWSVEATDGTVMEQGPGEIQFNADSGSKPQGPDNRAGHLTRQVGDVPTVQLIVSLRPQTQGRGTEPCQPAQR